MIAVEALSRSAIFVLAESITASQGEDFLYWYGRGGMEDVRRIRQWR